MQRAARMAIILAFSAAAAFADSPPVPAAHPMLQSVFVWAMGKAPADVAEVELDVLQALSQHQVKGERASKLFPNGLPADADEAIRRMRASGCEALLVLRKRSPVEWQNPTKDKMYSSLKAFLTHRSQLTKPKNQAEADVNTPIEVPNLYGNTAMEIVKGEFIVFDLQSEIDIWRGDSQVKSAKDLPQSDYYKRVAEKVTAGLVGAGLIPSRKK